jgi:uncharacterized protein YifE (UPF0438 family)
MLVQEIQSASQRKGRWLLPLEKGPNEPKYAEENIHVAIISTKTVTRKLANKYQIQPA